MSIWEVDQCLLSSKRIPHFQALQLIHTYFYGPARTRTLDGDRYFMLFIDDYVRITWVIAFREKYESFEIFNLLRLLLRMRPI